MESFTPYTALLGGVLIGISAVGLLAFNGRLAGVSNVLAGMVPPRSAVNDAWRLLFLAGIVVGAILHRLVVDPTATITFSAPMPMILLAGILVGLGARVAGGCTSGHGVCGVSLVSRRSLVATLAFLASGFATVFVIRHLLVA